MLLFFIPPSHLIPPSLFTLFCDWGLTKIFCINSFLHHQSGGPFINAPVVPQGFDRKSCVTQAVSLSASTFPPSSIGNAYLRKSANMFHSALPAPTAMPLLETSTGQLTASAAAATLGSFRSLNHPTSDVLSQGKKNPTPVRHPWENNLSQGEDGVAALGTDLCPAPAPFSLLQTS